MRIAALLTVLALASCGYRDANAPVLVEVTSQPAAPASAVDEPS